MTASAPLVGLDIGGTKTAAALVGPEGAVLGHRRVPTPARSGPEAVLDTAARLAAELLDAAGTGPVGVGTAGTVDPATGTIRYETGTRAGTAPRSRNPPGRCTLFRAQRGGNLRSFRTERTSNGGKPTVRPSGGPDLTLVARLAALVQVPVIAEGRYRNAEQIGRAFEAGAHAVVMGNAITSPLWITRHLVPATLRAV